MKTLLIVMLLLFAGCDKLLGFHPPKAQDDGGLGDAGGSGDAHVCVFDTNAPADEFDNGCVFGQ